MTVMVVTMMVMVVTKTVMVVTMIVMVVTMIVMMITMMVMVVTATCQRRREAKLNVLHENLLKDLKIHFCQIFAEK